MSFAAIGKILARMKPVVTTRQNLNRRHDTNFGTRFRRFSRKIRSRIVHREHIKIAASAEHKQKRIGVPIFFVKTTDLVFFKFFFKFFAKFFASFQIYLFDLLEERTKLVITNLIKRDDVLFLVHERLRFSAHELTDGTVGNL